MKKLDIVFWTHCPIHTKKALDTCYLCKTAHDLNEMQKAINERADDVAGVHSNKDIPSISA